MNMAQWFECKIRFDKTMEDGKIKRVTEAYMVDALTFTEAERRFLEEVEPFVSGDYEVADIKKAKLAEVMTSNDGNDDRWYKAKVTFITLDEKTAVEKRTAQNILVQARDLKTAVANLEKGMAGTMGDWELTAVNETAILDIYPYKAPSDSPLKGE
ncbi:MAG: DUF4494 domain-containing protein [Bacteroidaceae bacterium]|nr:DUF4494 domain-containing protein [Bacteroidaceae bacterium]